MRWYYLSATLHVLAAMLWLGGMFFLAIVGAPALREVQPPALRQQLFQRLGVRFRNAGWAAIGVLVVTGVINLHFRGWLRWDGVLGEPTFWASTVGRSLAWKLTGVGAMLAASAIHDFALGPAASRVGAGTPDAIRLRRRAAWLARLNALLGVVVVALAVRLARGG